METKEKSEKKENWLIRFIVSIVWLVVSIAIDFIAIKTNGYIIGAIAELAFFIVTFSIPYLRKKGTYTRWWGWLALLQAGWLLYLQFSSGS